MSYSSEVEEVLARQKSADLRNILAPLIPYLEKRDTRNINCGSDGKVWIEDDSGKYLAPFRLTIWERKQIISILAGQTGRQFHALSSRFEGELVDFDTRVTALCPPIGPGFPIMLRRHAAELYRLGDYVRGGQLTVTRAIAIRQAVRRRDNTFVAGMFGSGKTTFINCLLAEKARAFPDERLAIVQDSPELKSSHADTLWIFTRKIQERLDSTGAKSQFLYDFPDSLTDLARSDAQAIAWGEVRDPQSWAGLAEMMIVLRAMVTTIHADNARAVLQRCETLIKRTGQIPIREDLARSINFIVFMKRDRLGKHAITEVARVRPNLISGDYDLEYIA
jgi:Flp pilus assembly CpaF family ATPase